MGYLKTCTEANLSLTEMVQAGVEVRAASPLPLILDGACGWGDPMHMHHTISMAEAAGFSAIEVEDQLLPKRAHHHIGIEHIVPLELMIAKLKACLAARRSREFLIIARTTAARGEGLDEALRRGEAMHRAGADVLLVLPGKPDDIRVIAERLPAPLMFMMSGARLTSSGLTMREWGDLGYRLFVDASTPFMAMHHALRQCYAAMARGEADPLIGADTRDEQRRVHETIGLETMLAVEKRTVER
jgi:methylisocitrate lyase